MSMTRAMGFSCPYCMASNDIEVDEMNDIGQVLIMDCQVCCQPIELSVHGEEGEITLSARQENE